MSTVHLAERNLDQAIAEAKKAVELDRKRIQSYIRLAELYAAAKQPALAEEILKQAIGVDANSVEAHAAYGEFLRVTGRADESERQFKRVVELQPQKAESHVLLARFYIAGKRFDLAERVLQEAIANIVRHSGATLARTAIHYADNSVRTIIEDNGKGFAPGSSQDGRAGFGLKSMWIATLPRASHAASPSKHAGARLDVSHAASGTQAAEVASSPR